MYYCFVEEDLKELDEKDPLHLQAVYARHMEQYCILNRHEGSVKDEHGQVIQIEGEKVFLRASCEQMKPALKLLKEKGADLVEEESAIAKIWHWNELHLTRRKVLLLNLQDLKNGNFKNDMKELLREENVLFLKSLQKGFCVKVSKEKILNRDKDFLSFLEEKCSCFGEELLAAPFLTVTKDSLGKKESRHVVLNGSLLNSSRPIHSLVHAVPKSQIKKAEEVVNTLLQIEEFPHSYVVDIGEFERAGERYTDIVELNPLTCSLCYVNNSMFGKRKGIGLEYYYDSQIHPERYITERVFGINWEYDNKEHYDLT